MSAEVQFGVGLIRIGRRWGHVPQDVPSDTEALRFLEEAASIGIRYFDTAPAYGSSEKRLGAFLRGLTPETRRQLTVATKFGEHWDDEKQEPYVDHSFEALKRSLDESLGLLGSIDVLQLHKTTPDVLQSEAVQKAWEYARSAGVSVIGASVSDPLSAEAVLQDSQYRCIQIPLNVSNRTFAPVAASAASRGVFVATNRPFAMGSMLYAEEPVSKEAAFRYLLQQEFRGVILTGTGNAEHLRENYQVFRQAQSGAC